MKKSLLALAVLGAFAGAASAQSSVTVYGKVDQGFAKNIGSKDKVIQDAGGSRLGFRGVEDLGGGLSAVFGFEHRFSPDTGVAAATFWNGYSWVGLKGAFGTATLGRHYTAAFLLAQNQFDPFGGDTVAALRGVGVIPSSASIRVADSIKYDFSGGGFSVGANIAESIGVDRPYSIAANYAGGPVFVGASYENMSGINDNLATVGVRYDLRVVNLRAALSSGKTNADLKVRSYLLGVTAPVGSGLVKAGWAQNKIGTVRTAKVGVGYQHNLSKRTFLYADIGRQTKPSITEKTGYDLGIQHNF